MTAIDRAYYHANREKMLASQKRYEQRNKDKIKAYKVIWRSKTKDRMKIYQQWYKLFGKKPKHLTYEEMEKVVKDFVASKK